MGNTTTAGENVQHQADTDGIDLMQGESAHQNRRPSWALWWKQIALGAFVLLAGLGGDAAAGGILVGGGIFAYVVLARIQSRYVVTDERVKAKIGLLSKASREYRIADLNSLSTSQSIFERLVGHGSLTLRTASNDEIVWRGVPDYQDVANSIRQEQRKYD
ncbi:PH domain-containing protein [Halosimplex litoreum]|uniref:PH domain-containing protein n=1 Tax=Halosimplex litoreum TaxID=1198301 RepID=A0A7T3KUI6_9EURY|nr:PH domain-containing protein [Halosimplex litoreum]QPV62139.1 PH domain-containing protein [Halosimplex litoreum]